jgi:hypothetical protein
VLDGNLDPKNHKELFSEILCDMICRFFDGFLKFPELEPGNLQFKKIRGEPVRLTVMERKRRMMRRLSQ